jgi:hypothetical protein
MVKPLAEMQINELWRGELGVELAQLKELQTQIISVEAKLDELAALMVGCSCCALSPALAHVWPKRL